MLYTAIKICIINKSSSDVLRLDIIEKFFKCIHFKISLTCCTVTGAIY